MGGSLLREGASIGIGVFPGVGSIQSIVELVSGQDYITGEETSRIVAGIGLAAGLIPFGKAGVKSAAKFVTLSRLRALRDLGVSKLGRREFFEGGVAQFNFATRGGDDVIGFIKLQGDRITSQLFSINNTAGGAVAAFRKFVKSSVNVARKFGSKEIELQGGAVINQNVAEGLLSRGFKPKTIDVPEALGGGTEEVLFKNFPVD